MIKCVCVAEARPVRSAAEAQRELEAREAARSRVKLIWRALAAMVSGLLTLVIQLSSALHLLVLAPPCGCCKSVSAQGHGHETLLLRHISEHVCTAAHVVAVISHKFIRCTDDRRCIALLDAKR